MGRYNTYGTRGIQLKNDDKCNFSHFHVGDKVDLPDGIYVGYEGFVVIVGSRMVAEYPPDRLIDKWGETVHIDMNKRNPVTAVVEQIELKYHRNDNG